MPYRIDISHPPAKAFDTLVDLGALDIEAAGDVLAAILPDSISVEALRAVLGPSQVVASTAVARDDESVWMVAPRSLRVGSLLITPPVSSAGPESVQLIDSGAFGTGHHSTTLLCLEALQELLAEGPVENLLDIGTGSGILALAALAMGVPRAVGLDIDAEAVEAATMNARLNRVGSRLRLVLGGPGDVDGVWPLIVANVLAAPLIELAPLIVRRMASHARIILSGIPSSLASEVRQAYQHYGVHHLRTEERGGWVMILGQASW